jgi:hypothetical protein
MSSVSQIKDQLKIILGAVEGINQAFDYLPRYIDQDNTIGIYWDGGTFEPAEIASHWAHYKFTIITAMYMFDETSIQEDQEQIALLELSALRAKPSLNSTCLKQEVQEVKNDYVKNANGNVYATIEITLIADIEEDD